VAPVLLHPLAGPGSQPFDRPVKRRAPVADSAPMPVPVTRFHSMHGAPQPGVASDTKVSGNITRNPTSAPRRHHGRGQCVMPTKKPISERATYQPQTAMLPSM